MSEEKKKNMTPQPDAQETAAPQETAQDIPVQDAPEGAPSPEESFTVSRVEMEKLEGLAKLVSDTNDKYLRLAAEYDNYRKRTAREKETVYTDARADTIKPFLDVYDNLVRGAAQLDDGDSHKQGLEMIAKQFLAVLEKLGVTEIEAEGQPFDPTRHNAVMHVEDDGAGENTVVEVFQKGFALGERVLRFSMVKVAN